MWRKDDFFLFSIQNPSKKNEYDQLRHYFFKVEYKSQEFYQWPIKWRPFIVLNTISETSMLTLQTNLMQVSIRNESQKDHFTSSVARSKWNNFSEEAEFEHVDCISVEEIKAT